MDAVTIGDRPAPRPTAGHDERFATQIPLPTRNSAANTAGVSGSPRISPPASTPITGVRKENEDRRVAGYSRTSQNQAR